MVFVVIAEFGDVDSVNVVVFAAVVVNVVDSLEVVVVNVADSVEVVVVRCCKCRGSCCCW